MIAAITSCTNTSNPSRADRGRAAGAQRRKRGLDAKPWVKTSLAPGRRSSTDYLDEGGLDRRISTQLGFNLVGYGCTTCIGNSGPLIRRFRKRSTTTTSSWPRCFRATAISKAASAPTFRRIISRRRRSSSPTRWPAPCRHDLDTRALGTGTDGKPVYLKDIWPTSQEIQKFIVENITRGDVQVDAMPTFSKVMSNWQGDRDRQRLNLRLERQFDLRSEPALLPNDRANAKPVADIVEARILALFGDKITTDHISPAGEIKAASPAGQYLLEHGVQPVDFNQYGTRRGNHEVMMRGTFANIRIKNYMTKDATGNVKEGGLTIHYPSGQEMAIYDAAMLYEKEGVPLVVFAGIEYGNGSSRDWAAKGTNLLGVRAVIARVVRTHSPFEISSAWALRRLPSRRALPGTRSVSKATSASRSQDLPRSSRAK